MRQIKPGSRKFLPFILIIGILFFIALFLAIKSPTDSVVKFIFSGGGLASDDRRVNVLLLGTSGDNHDGPNLTDTIMVASYNLDTHNLYLASIPRDLWLPEFKLKANAVYQKGLNQGNGLNFTQTVIGNIVGLPLHYSLRIDFSGFVKIIDALGGIEVEVAKAFDDYNYPIQGAENDLCGYTEKEIDFSPEEAKELNIESGKRKVFIAPDGKIATDSAQEDQGAKYFSCRYEHISFEKGAMHMNGAIALSFVRSRHGTNGESSDFARSKRQEAVIMAIRNKLLSVETLSNPQKISDLIKILGKSIDTNIGAKEAIEFYKLSKQLNKTKTLVIDDSILFHPNPADYGGAYVLVSQDDDFSIISSHVRKLVTGGLDDESSASARPRYK